MPKDRIKTEYKDGRLYSAYWDVWISGTKLNYDKKSCITSISITETVTGSDTATLQIVDPQYMYIEDNIFYEDNPIKIKYGWAHSSYRRTFKGYISAIDIQFGQDGIPTLSVMCMDNTHKMNRKEKTKTWKNTTSEAVVKAIAKKYGFKFKGEKGYKFEKQETISQNNQTDIAFITQLASNEVYPFTARLVGKTFYYQKKGTLKDPKMNLFYKQFPYDIISFSPKINKETLKTNQSGGSTDTGTKGSAVSTVDVPLPKQGGTTSSGGNSNSGGSGGSGNGGSNGSSSSGSYTYNPETGGWTHNK